MHWIKTSFECGGEIDTIYSKMRVLHVQTFFCSIFFLYNFLFHRINSRVNSSVIFHLFIHLFKLSIAFWLTVSCGHFSYSHEKHMRFGYNNNENDWEIGEWMFVSVMWIMIYIIIHRSVEFRMPKSSAELYNMNNNNNCFVPRKQRKTKHSWWDLWGYGCLCCGAIRSHTSPLMNS